MKSFKRTISGISNQHLFHNVEIIVFVEGGEENFTKDEIDNNFYSDHSIDILFWSEIFKKFHKPLKIKFKAVGSKATVVKIAEDVIEENIATVYVAMDKEFDEPMGKMIKHKNILYSFGYSWENDAWNENLIKKIIHQLTAFNIDDEKVDTLYFQFVKDIKMSVFADSFQFSKKSSFFPRNGHLKIIDCHVKNAPRIKNDQIESLFNIHGLKKSTVRAHGYRNSISSIKNCYGHLFGDFCRHIVHHLIKMEYRLGAIDKEIIRRLAINNFIDHMSVEVINYHNSQFSR